MGIGNNAHAARSLYAVQRGQTYSPQLWKSGTRIAKPIGLIAICIQTHQQPNSTGVQGVELDDRVWIDSLAARTGCAVGQHLRTLQVSEKGHGKSVKSFTENYCCRTALNSHHFNGASHSKQKS